MSAQRPRSVEEVAERQLCTGCGACAFVCPEGIRMVDTLEHGRRPLLRAGVHDDERSREALAVCPGVGQARVDAPQGADPALMADWGPVLEVWEGHATDPDIRFRGSSGGVLSAISVHCLERAGMEGVLHVTAREDEPLLNRTVLSRTRDDVLSAAGSRYSPASPCEELHQIEKAAGPCVFVGKPCDVAAVHECRRRNPRLDRNTGLVMSIFCAGTPTLAGTLDLVQTLGIDDPANVEGVRYRGHGWPGRMTAWRTGSARTTSPSTTYDVGWGDILQRKRQWRCYVCADHTGELGDLSIGDPWYRPVRPGESGRSLVLVRTERGRQLLRKAMEDGYVELVKRDSWTLPASQRHLLRARAASWGRILACRLVGAAAPRYRGLQLFTTWRRALGLREKLQSVLGTFKRVVRKGLLRRQLVEEFSWTRTRFRRRDRQVEAGHQDATEPAGSVQ